MTSTDSLSRPDTGLPKVRGRRRWLLPMLMIVVFVSGTVVGAGSALLFVRSRALMRIHDPHRAVAMDTARLQRALDLTDDQAQKVDATFLARHAAIYRDVQREFDRLEDEVDAVLTAEQKPRWRSMLEWFRQRWIPRGRPQPHE